MDGVKGALGNRGMTEEASMREQRNDGGGINLSMRERSERMVNPDTYVTE